MSVLFQFVVLCLHVESTSFSLSNHTEITIVYYSVEMNSQSGSTNKQTSRSLVEREDPVVQSGTSGVGPSTGQEDRRIGDERILCDGDTKEDEEGGAARE